MKNENDKLFHSSPLLLTLKAWPVIALATIGLCFLTQTVAGFLGIELPDQSNIEVVRRCAGLNLTFAFLCAQVIIILPAVEELIFRWLLFRLPSRAFGTEPSTSNVQPATLITAAVSSIAFSAAHYIAQPFPDNAFLALFFFGLAQCWLYRRSDRLWCAILNHGLFNLTNLVLLFILPSA